MAAEPPLRMLIVDDEVLAVERLAMICATLADVIVVATAAGGGEALKLIAALEPDLVLLDIAMPELNGFDVARSVASAERGPAIVFTTAFDHFAVEAFDVEAVDYLLKPVTPERLLRAVARVAHARAAPIGSRKPSDWAEEFWVPHRGDLVRIASRDIDRIEADRDYMHLHVGARRYLLRETIGRLHARLRPQTFIRVHRSHIVRRDRIERLVRNGPASSVVLVDGTALPIGRSYLAEVMAMIAA